jgi:hypothetical protein
VGFWIWNFEIVEVRIRGKYLSVCNIQIRKIHQIIPYPILPSFFLLIYMSDFNNCQKGRLSSLDMGYLLWELAEKVYALFLLSDILIISRGMCSRRF